MNFNILRRVSRIAAIGAILLGSASCVYVNEELGQNLIPTDQKWDVFNPEAVVLEDIQLHTADSLSAYNSNRFTFGAICDPLFGTSMKSTSFTLIPLSDSLDFGKNTKVRQFHLSALLDTVSTYNESQTRILQNVYVSELKTALDTMALYTGTFMDPANRAKYLDTENRITTGVPVYDGGDSLSFDFSIDFAERLIKKLDKKKLDSIDVYTGIFPGIYIETDTPVVEGGRINMFDLKLQRNSDYYITGNYAELKVTADYGDRTAVDTSFLFLFGSGTLMTQDILKTGQVPAQFAFNASSHQTIEEDFTAKWNAGTKDKMYVEGGSGMKPVVTAKEIKAIVHNLIAEAGITDPRDVVINKASIILPYEMPADYKNLDKYPTILSPTVKLHGEDGGYVTYAGLTDSSVQSEDQGDINRSTFMYSPDISHHVQMILNLDEADENFEKNISKYDIWMLIMHDETIKKATNSNTTNDLYNSLLYSSYYNNMMYGGYGGYGGYGYGGYGYGGYGYDSYGYGYNNYMNYMMMASMAGSYSTGEETERSLDKDRFYNAILNGPGAAGEKPRLKITFSAPKTAEK